MQNQRKINRFRRRCSIRCTERFASSIFSFSLLWMSEWVSGHARASEYELEPNFISISFHFSSFSLFFASFRIFFRSVLFNLRCCSSGRTFIHICDLLLYFIYFRSTWSRWNRCRLSSISQARSLFCSCFSVSFSFSFLSLSLSLTPFNSSTGVRASVGIFCLFMVSSCSRVQTKIQSWHWLIQFVS